MRVIAPDVGGGFGAKIGAYPEELLLGAAGQRGRPARALERDPHREHGRPRPRPGPGPGRRRSAAPATARSLAYRLDVLQDGGAYPTIGTHPAPFMTRTMASGVYDIPKVECTAASVVTNTTPTVAYRGAGRPEATAAIERAMDLFAAEIGMDPAEVRRRNLIAKFDEPYTTAIGHDLRRRRLRAALDLVLEAAGYDELRAEQQRRRDARRPGAARHRRVSSTSRSPAASPPFGERRQDRGAARRPAPSSTPARRRTGRATTRRGR